MSRVVLLETQPTAFTTDAEIKSNNKDVDKRKKKKEGKPETKKLSDDEEVQHLLNLQSVDEILKDYSSGSNSPIPSSRSKRRKHKSMSFSQKWWIQLIDDQPHLAFTIVQD